MKTKYILIIILLIEVSQIYSFTYPDSIESKENISSKNYTYLNNISDSSSQVLIKSQNSENKTSNESKSLINIISNDFKDAFSDLKFVLKSISNPSNTDLIYTGAAIGVSGLSFFGDNSIRKSVRDFAKNNPSDLFKITNSFGGIEGVITLTGGLYTIGLLSGIEKIRNSGRLITEAAVLSGTVVYILKVATGRCRPFREKGNTDFNWFETDNSMNSFPSGHTAFVFSAATVLSYEFNNWFAQVLFYTAAASTSFSRIYYDQHWFSDCVTGALIGIASGITIIKASNNTENQNKSLNFNFTPTEINLSYRF